MRTVKLTEAKIKGDWNRKQLTKTDYSIYLDEGDVEVLGPDGEQICVVLRGKYDKAMLQNAWKILKKVNLKTENRGSASGVKAVPRIKKDGTISKTTRVPKGFEVISGVMGYYPRYPRIPYCRECAWNQNHPEEFKQLLPLFMRTSELHKQYSPQSYAFQESVVEKTSKDFVIPGTIYTTVTVNKNFRTACHLDAKNLLNGMAAMLYMRQGKFTGGDVVLPEWGAGVKLETGDLIIFRNMKDYHGNTKIVPISKDYQRCTLVFYYREEMMKCGTAEQELERAKSGEDFSKNFGLDRVCEDCPDKEKCTIDMQRKCFSGDENA